LRLLRPLVPPLFPYTTLFRSTGTLAVVLACWLAWAARLHPSAPGRLANRAVALGYAIPGSVIAVGTLVPFGLLDNALDAWLRAQDRKSTRLNSSHVKISYAVL